MALCPAGKLMSPDLINREAFRSLIARIWKIQEGVEIEVISNIIYAFHFQSMDDRRRVLMGGPWSFDEALIVLKEPGGKFLRVRVAVEIDKHLRRFLRVDVLGDGDETVMPIQYERLLNFCFLCGMIRYTVRDCSNKGVGGSYDGKDMVYGAWLKAVSSFSETAWRSWGSRFGIRNQEEPKHATNLVEEVHKYKQQSCLK
ncbi:hypothetical protein QYF36_006908 [Acer negundo]|nr:hypothetical protein QYF36_006908 [Acer negundo]